MNMLFAKFANSLYCPIYFEIHQSMAVGRMEPAFLWILNSKI